MSKFLIKRLFQTIPVLIFMSMIVFGLTLLIPGDPVVALLGPSTTRSLESVELAREELGLNDPIPVQYLNWMGRVLQGDLGRSTSTNQPVGEALAKRLPVTAQLAVFSLLIALLIALPLGVLAATRANTGWDLLASLISVVGIALPNFWLAILLIWLFAVTLRILPASGHVSFFQDPVEAIRHMILPALALGASASAVLMRHIRSSLLEVLRADYIRTARSKGLRDRVVLFRHGLRNSLISVVTVAGLVLASLMGGSLIVESIFLVPGVGSMMVNAIFDRDFPTVQSGALVLATVVILINLSVDLLYGFLDPRIQQA